MPTENFAKYLENQRLQLEAQQNARLRKAKRKKYRVPLNRESTPARLVKGDTSTPSAPTFFSTWNTMYRRRIGNGQGVTIFALPESLIDTLIGLLEQLISKLIKKLLP